MLSTTGTFTIEGLVGEGRGKHTSMLSVACGDP